MIEEIKALKELLDMGAITQEEYDLKKQEILNAAKMNTSAPSTKNQQSSILQPAPKTTKEKSKNAAGLLAIFLGGLGIHKFYLGYTMQGIILILVSIFGSLLIVGPIISGIISFIEGIIYLTKSDEDFYTTYVLNKREWF